MSNKLMLKVLLFIFMVAIIIKTALFAKRNRNKNRDEQHNNVPSGEDESEYRECEDKQDRSAVRIENIQTIDVLLEVNNTSEITSFRKAQIKMSRGVYNCIDVSYEYYHNISSKVIGETWKWRQDKMVEMISRLMVIELTAEEYVMACLTSVALAATMGLNGKSNSQKLKNVSINDIMNFDYLYMKYTSVWLKFCVIILTREKYDMLSVKCSVLAKNIVNMHGDGNISELSWNWEVNKGINTIDLEKWVKSSCMLLDSQNKTAVLIGDKKWWVTQGVADIRSDKDMDRCTMLSANVVGCKHVDYLLIMGKVKILDKRMLIMFGCRECVTTGITEELEKEQDKIWIIL